MKKKIVLFSAAILTTIALSFTGCSKDDETAPVISLSGSSSVDVPLNSVYTDAGATANDDEDGSITVVSDASSSNPNVNKSGTYVITYTATDEAGNVASETRTVRVFNEAEDFEGTYNNCVDTCVTGGPSAFATPAIVTLSDSMNRLVKISNFGAFGANINVYAKITANSPLATVTVDENQSVGGIAYINHAYDADSWVISAAAASTAFRIRYGWTDGTDSDVCITYYIR